MPNEFDHIDKYFAEELTPGERSAFERRLDSDPAFAEEVAFYLSARSAAREASQEEAKARMKAMYAGMDKEEVPSGSAMRWLKPVLSVAAVFVVGLVTWFFFLRSPDASELADGYVKDHFMRVGVEMGAGEDPMQKAKERFNQGSLEESGRLFEEILGRDATDPEALKMAGIVSLRLGKYDQALGYFRKLSTQSGLHGNPGPLYEAVTLMKRKGPGDIAEAKRILEAIVSQGREGATLAKTWLEKL